jgi:hypothetical protein
MIICFAGILSFLSWKKLADEYLALSQSLITETF